MTSGEKLRINPYDRGPELHREDFLDPANPVREFQLYDKLNGINTIVYEGYVDHFEDEAGVPTDDMDQAYYIVVTSKLDETQIDNNTLGHSVKDNSFVAGWDQEQYWLTIDNLFGHIRYKVCRPLSQYE